MPDLVLGPVLRYADGGSATVWVQTSAPCRVEVLGVAERTFCVGGRHYALVPLEGLGRGATAYGVSIDGVPAWPRTGFGRRPSAVRAAPEGARARIAVGSCRVAASHAPPRTASAAAPPRGHGADALAALAHRLAGEGRRRWPDLLLLIGDQVYVDHPSLPPPRDFAGHAEVYRRAWVEPAVRWLLSTVPSLMMLDDHDVRDGWNATRATSARGREDAGERDRTLAALAAYWVHQHLGNLSPAELGADPLLTAVRAECDGLPVLLAAAERWARGEPEFGVARRIGPARLVAMDARGRRVLGPGARSVLDEGGWSWLDRRVRGDAEHLLLATSVPAYMTGGLHDLEAWATALADGAWGPAGRWLGRRLRRRLALEHWPAYPGSRTRLDGMLGEVSRGARGAAPASIVVLAGEVHHGSVARVGLPRAGSPPVWHVASSPLRNPLGRPHRLLLRLAATGPFRWVMRVTARLAGVRRPAATTRLVAPLVFANHLVELDLEGRSARATFATATVDGDGRPALRLALERRLS